MSTGKCNLARNRWSLLQEAILNKRIPENNPASKRVFEKFTDIINWSSDSSTGEVKVQITVKRQQENNKLASLSNKCSQLNIANNTNNDNCNSSPSSYSISVFRNSQSSTLDIDDLQGFDKTGRICIWPAEQVLAYWCLKNFQLFENKTIIEIGGGFHCLAGLVIAKFLKAKEVVLTDGDPTNLEEVKKSISNNSFITKSVSANLLRWDGYTIPDLEGRFDQVIAADVVYDSCVFDPLIKTVSKLLKPGGQFILFNPTRVAKLIDLVEAAKKSELFQEIQIYENFDVPFSAIVQHLEETDQSFNKDWHYPYQVIFYK